MKKLISFDLVLAAWSLTCLGTAMFFPVKATANEIAPPGCSKCISDNCPKSSEDAGWYDFLNPQPFPVTRCVDYDNEPPAHCATFTALSYDIWWTPDKLHIAYTRTYETCTRIPCDAGNPIVNRPCNTPWTNGNANPNSLTCKK